MIQGPGNIKHLSAAVTVAQLTPAAGANGTASPRDNNDSAARLEKIEKLVASVVGIQTNRGDVITVQEFPFQNPLAADLTRHIEVQQRQEFFWNLARNLGYPALALAILFVFARAFKRTSNEDLSLGLPLGRLGAHGNGAGHQFGFGENGEDEDEVVTVQVLNQLIKENPQNMTNAIRTWLTRGATPPK